MKRRAPSKPRKKGSSIYTLATELNLNPGTISRALRNRPEVRPETRALVQKRADELGFKLKKFRPRAINICALVQTDSAQSFLFSSYTDAVMDGLWRYCMQNDLELSLYSAPLARLNAGFLVRQLAHRGAHGAVVINASDASRYFRLFQKEQFPFCAVLDGPAEARPWLLSVDNKKLAKRAVEYLIGLGHRRIAMLCGPSEFDTFRSRLEGYRQALQEHGIGEDPRLVLFPENRLPLGSDDFVFGATGATELLQLAPPPTAIVAMSDESAIGVLHSLHRAGKSVPADLSLLCFDDARLARYVSPALTVVNIPNTELGFEAGSIVHQRILKKEFAVAGDSAFPRTADLVIRDSCGPPKKNTLAAAG
jgi:LacI family transcriptional regulator